MVDAKCALKHLFELAADIRAKAIDTEYENKDLISNFKDKEKNYIDTIEDLNNKLKMTEAKYGRELDILMRENQEQIDVYLKLLSTKDHETNDDQLRERLKIQARELERKLNVEEENVKLKEENERLKRTIIDSNEHKENIQEMSKVSNVFN